ncbi:hypothetical protein L227DRAFT_563343 [Lentinus tigrinus ALCF2SS1-6]|uniref:Uncharacterized protein n=1 Tax=Lentinus tigrinus ALCF2SS1-6 TaxID=1328759 RepID=A0A5C2SHR2_9APHY|nr:hypothetical protein L227DRAFT_563343 [Lentinus tigrinus ALCF2SS1-6]
MASKFLHPIAIETLYKHIRLQSPEALRVFRKTLESTRLKKGLISMKIEWPSTMRILVCVHWHFIALMDALRNHEMKHLAILTNPNIGIPMQWTLPSPFELAVRRQIKEDLPGLPGVYLPQSLRSLEIPYLLTRRLVAPSPGMPVAPLVAISLHGDHGEFYDLIDETRFPQVNSTARTLRRLRVATIHPRWHNHPLEVCHGIHMNLPNLEYLEVHDDVSFSTVSASDNETQTATDEVLQKNQPDMSPRMSLIHLLGLDGYEHVNEHLPRLRVLVWVPAWGDVDDLSPRRKYGLLVEDIRKDVFGLLKNIRTFVVMLPRERCVRFESSDIEPSRRIVPRDRFDDLDWRHA